MKTPMQEMIQNIIDIESKTYNQEQLYMLNALKVSALILLEKEKEHIIDAWLGTVCSSLSRIAAEKYFNEKYNQTK